MPKCDPRDRFVYPYLLHVHVNLFGSMLPNIYVTEEDTFTVFKGSVLFPPVAKPLFQNQENRSLKKYIFEVILLMYFLVLQNIDSGYSVRRCIHN